MLSHSEAKALSELLSAEREARARYALALLTLATIRPMSDDYASAQQQVDRRLAQVERLTVLTDTRLSELTAARQPLTTVGR
jgi:hypothetical protein